jgi:hypothetical protein
MVYIKAHNQSMKATGDSPVALCGGQCPRALFLSLGQHENE